MCGPLSTPRGPADPASLESEAHSRDLAAGRGPTLLPALPKPSLGLSRSLGASDNSQNSSTGVKSLESESQLHRQLAQ